MSITSNNLSDKIEGALFGFAIGDAMGATTEFMTKEQIKQQYGKVDDIIGKGWLNLNPGQVTDDTQMMLCVANALISNFRLNKDFAHQCSENFADWFLYDKPKDVGGQCAKGIRNFISGIEQPIENDALGNGSLMRALPCALVDKLEFNKAQGQLTHNNNICTNAISVYHTCLRAIIENNFKSFIIKYGGKSRFKLMNPSGYITNTLNNCLYWLINTTNFKDAIIYPVNHGGDADTIAALTGGLAGALYGIKNIPNKWIDELDISVKKELINFKDFVISYVQK